jgi:hypothetical protein
LVHQAPEVAFATPGQVVLEAGDELTDVPHDHVGTLQKQKPVIIFCCFFPFNKTKYVASSPPATEETGTMGLEIESRQGVGW